MTFRHYKPEDSVLYSSVHDHNPVYVLCSNKSHENRKGHRIRTHADRSNWYSNLRSSIP